MTISCGLEANLAATIIESDDLLLFLLFKELHFLKILTVVYVFHILLYQPFL